MPETIILVVGDLLLASKLENLVRHHNYNPIFATDTRALTAAMTCAPVLAIVDLAATTFKWESMVRAIKGPGKQKNHVPMLAFGPHTDLDLRRHALDLGCEAVVARSAIVDDLSALIGKHHWQVSLNGCDEKPNTLVQQGFDAFNEGRYYQCHNFLEDAWMQESRQLRLLYQGILQIAVGFFHITKDNWRGAVKILERGIPKTARFQPNCLGIDVVALVSAAQIIHADLIAGGAENMHKIDVSTFPKIELSIISSRHDEN